MIAKPLPPADILRQFLEYRPESGALIWQRRSREMMPDVSSQVLGMWNARYAGTEASFRDRRGYKRLRLHNVGYPAHRVIWKMVNGEDPPYVIDHINGDPGDNRLLNLRATTQAENTKNSSLRKGSSSGAIGVSWNKAAQKWYAHIRSDGVMWCIGMFETFNDALVARKFAERVFGFHENHGRLPSS